MRDTDAGAGVSSPIMIGIGKWKYLAGDGLEEALMHEDSGYWVPLRQVREIRNVTYWMEHIGATSWATKQDLVDLATLLLRHVDNIMQIEEELAASTRMATKDAEAKLATAAARAAANALARLSSGEMASVRTLGTKWGTWAYEDHARLGPSIVHDSGYRIDLARVRTPEELGNWVQHMTYKEWLTGQGLADLTEALLACFAEGVHLKDSTKTPSA